MAKIKAGAIALVAVHIENRTEAGRFAVHLKNGTDVTLLEVLEARRLAEILNDAADKAEILDAAMQ
jgi:hypothetical protein